MPAAFDWLGVGDVALERPQDRSATRALGGTAARLTAHAAVRGLTTALVAKTGDDAAGRIVRAALARVGVDLHFSPVASGQRTTVLRDARGPAGLRRLERGCDLLLRLDEIPPPSVLRARLTVVSGYSLSIEPARSAALGALATAAARGARAALQLDAELLWSANARMARRVLEPALASAQWVGLTAADAAVLFGTRTTAPQVAAAIGRLGPTLVYLAAADGGLELLDGDRHHTLPPGRHGIPADRLAGPAAFFAGVLLGLTPRKAGQAALEYAHLARRPSPRKPGRRSARV